MSSVPPTQIISRGRRIAQIYREEADPYSLYDMTERSDARFEEATIGASALGSSSMYLSEGPLTASASTLQIPDR